MITYSSKFLRDNSTKIKIQRSSALILTGWPINWYTDKIEKPENSIILRDNHWISINNTSSKSEILGKKQKEEPVNT